LLLCSIIGTLAGTSAFGPVAGHSETTHLLETIRSERAHQHVESQGFVNGEIEAISTGELGDSYIKVRKIGGAEEEAATEEEEAAAPAETEEGEAKDEENTASEPESSDDGEK
jgi:hypothetical protein